MLQRLDQWKIVENYFVRKIVQDRIREDMYMVLGKCSFAEVMLTRCL